MKLPAAIRRGVFNVGLATISVACAGPGTAEAAVVRQRADSASILRAAQRATYDGATRRRFEERERRHPPNRTESRHQYLLRYLEFAAERRERAIRSLDDYALDLPGDDWITGHRVGLRIREGRLEEAAAIAGECLASRWWCDALLGATHHLQGRIVEADSSFAAALSAMPAAERCAWLEDLSVVLSGAVRAAWSEADCARRAAMLDRLWWLGDPLHIRAGNERRTEQLFRAVTMRLHHEELAVTGGECQDDHHIQHLEAGWGHWWWETGMGISSQDLRTLWDSRGFHFMPGDGVWLRPTESGEEEWTPEWVDVGERYRPAFGSLAALPHQTGFFARGDSILVVTAASPGGTASVVGVALSRNEREQPYIAEQTNVTGIARLSTRVPRDAWLVSVEAIGQGGAFRSRFGHPLPSPTASGVSLSDLLLFELEDGLDESLDAVAPRMLGSTKLAAERAVGVFWEVYGVTDKASLNVSLTVRSVDTGFVRRVGEALGLLSPQPPATIDWAESVESGGFLAKHLRLDLSDLPAGRYELEIRVDDGTGARTMATRRFEIAG